jgi:hypothetical protein
MNERIKDLAEQAGFEIEAGGHIMLHHLYLTGRMEKFAELLIRECLSYMKDGDVDFAKFMIKKHFGVEE